MKYFFLSHKRSFPVRGGDPELELVMCSSWKMECYVCCWHVATGGRSHKFMLGDVDDLNSE